MLADSLTELFAARSMIYETARAIDDGRGPQGRCTRSCSMAKLYASEMAGRVADRAVQVFGGRGYMRENVAERFFRELRVERIWEGASEVQRLIIADQLGEARAAPSWSDARSPLVVGCGRAVTADPPPSWTGLVDDAAIFPPGNAAAHRRRGGVRRPARRRAYADLVGTVRRPRHRPAATCRGTRRRPGLRRRHRRRRARSPASRRWRASGGPHAGRARDRAARPRRPGRQRPPGRRRGRRRPRRRASSTTTSRSTSSCRQAEPTAGWLAAADEVAARRAPPEVPHRRRSRPHLFPSAHDARRLDRRGAGPGDAVQVHRRAAPRGAAHATTRPASSTTASSTSCSRPGAPSTAAGRRRGRRDPRRARRRRTWSPRPRAAPTWPAPGAGSRRSAPARSPSRSTT